MGGPAGTRFRHCLVGFDGGALELFEFVGPDMPDWARRRDERRLPHLAMRVDDVDAALERVERAGGRRLWPAPRSAGGIGNVYVADPDGNVLELIDAAIEAIAAATIAAAPESDPRIGRERDRG
jgi:catechol 2,3-dioxygenase-like lactoylglutathione lyase family enzyme